MRPITCVMLLCVSCAASIQDAKFLGGNGNSCATAVKISGVDDERTGVQAERLWLDQHFPGYKLTGQALTDCSGRKTDRLGITAANGSKQEVYFDISEFFGKY